jgi:hypothetical protein
MNPKFILTVGLFCVSELLPFLPIKSNGFVQLAVNILHETKLVTDEQFERLHPSSSAPPLASDGTIKECKNECFDIVIKRSKTNGRIKISI